MLPPPPRWIKIPFRVVLFTVLFALMAFSVSLLFGIVGIAIRAQLAGTHPDLPFAYKQIALPVAVVAGAIVFVLSLMMEIRHYRQMKVLARIERASVVTPRIAIPMPHSGDSKYAKRSLPPYETAIRMAGGEPVRIPLDAPADDVRQSLETCDGVLLPGSRADVDPAKYGAGRDPHTADADVKRDIVDELLLNHAYETRKPVLGICYGLQILNVHRRGTLLQHIESTIPHSPERGTAHAHDVEVEPGSQLAAIVGVSKPSRLPVNSSHHQSAAAAGDGLRVVAHSPADGVIEAIEGTSPDHFVLAVQWHPERSVKEAGALGESARAIFRRFVEQATARRGLAS